jgi:hypothetical protein
MMISNLAALHTGFLMRKENDFITKNNKDIWRTSCFVIDALHASSLNRVRAGRGLELMFFFT